jgi:hypothetical protein
VKLISFSLYYVNSVIQINPDYVVSVEGVDRYRTEIHLKGGDFHTVEGDVQKVLSKLEQSG